jgi:hypothetical protein
MYAGLDKIGTDAELATLIAVLERVVAGHPSGDAIAARVSRDTAVGDESRYFPAAAMDSKT